MSYDHHMSRPYPCSPVRLHAGSPLFTARPPEAVHHSPDGLLDLWNLLYFEQCKHRLAKDYFALQDLWFIVLPSTLFGLLAAIMSFVLSSETLDEDTRIAVSVAAGCFALFCTSIQTLGNKLGWGSRRDAHDAVAQELKHILDELDFQSRKPDHLLRSRDDHEVEIVLIKYSQILSQCKSLLPSKVQVPFQYLEVQVREYAWRMAKTCGNADEFFWLNSKAYLLLHNRIYNKWFWPVRNTTTDEVDEVLNSLGVPYVAVRQQFPEEPVPFRFRL